MSSSLRSFTWKPLCLNIGVTARSELKFFTFVWGLVPTDYHTRPNCASGTSPISGYHSLLTMVLVLGMPYSNPAPMHERMFKEKFEVKCY